MESMRRERLGWERRTPDEWARKIETAKAEPEIVTRNGKPVSVILPIATYEELLERVEGAKDRVAEEGGKKPMQYRPLSEYLADRKARV